MFRVYAVNAGGSSKPSLISEHVRIIKPEIGKPPVIIEQLRSITAQVMLLHIANIK